MPEFKRGEIVKTGRPVIEEVVVFDNRHGNREANVKKLATLVEEAKQKLDEAIKFADEKGLSFHWDSEYGSRKQLYIGVGCDEKDHHGGVEGWVSSSDVC
jgi:hypothetical protein